MLHPFVYLQGVYSTCQSQSPPELGRGDARVSILGACPDSYIEELLHSMVPDILQYLEHTFTVFRQLY